MQPATRRVALHLSRSTHEGPSSIHTRHEVGEPVEEVRGVVRSGGGLGVVLDGERGDVEAAQALDDAVVETDVADVDAAEGRPGRTVDRRVDREAVVVRADLDTSGYAVLHGLVDAAVAETQLVR